MMHQTATFSHISAADYGFGNYGQTSKYENVESRTSAMMETSPFGEMSTANRKQLEFERKNRLEALVKEGVLRPSDVFMKSGNNRFLARLVPGTISYYQRIRENNFLFQEYQSSSHDSEKQRIIQEIVESVWLNEGRFLLLDKDENTVVVVDDQKLPGMIVNDFLCRENAFPALWSDRTTPGTNHTKPKKTSLSKKKQHNPLLDRALTNGRKEASKTKKPPKNEIKCGKKKEQANNGQKLKGTENKKKTGGFAGKRGKSLHRGSRSGHPKSRRNNNGGDVSMSQASNDNSKSSS